MQKGERVGLNKFGRRGDAFLTPDVHLRVRVGDRAQGGASVIGELP